MGTVLLGAGIPLASCLEALCLRDPDRIRRIHDDYIGAGAQVIETNTFGANAVRLERSGLEHRVAEINRVACRLARAAVGARDIFVAGSVGPLGLTADEAARRGIDRAECFREQITALVDGGADLIFFETFRDLDEMALALRINNMVGDAQAICSFACARDGLLVSGASVASAFEELRMRGAKVVGLNCVNGPETTVQLLEQVHTASVVVAYPNAGVPTFEHGQYHYESTPDDFARGARRMISRGVRLIGGCCGTTPDHVRAIADAIRANLA